MLSHQELARFLALLIVDRSLPSTVHANITTWLIQPVVPAFWGGTVVKITPASAGDTRKVGLIPGSGRSSGEGDGNPFQYSCQENSEDRGDWRAKVHGVTKSQERHTHLPFYWVDSSRILTSAWINWAFHYGLLAPLLGNQFFSQLNIFWKTPASSFIQWPNSGVSVWLTVK